MNKNTLEAVKERISSWHSGYDKKNLNIKKSDSKMEVNM